MKCPDIGVLCLQDEELFKAYLHDASPLKGDYPELAFFPKDAQEVAKVIRWANGEKVSIYPFGGGTSLVGSPLPNGGAILDTSLLDYLEVSPKDKLALVGASWKPSELNEVLKEYSLWFPVDPGSYDIATIGGMVATNAGGIRAVKYGVTADRVQGLEFVTPTGEVVWSGSWTRKSSTWMRIQQLLIGSEGTLGVITKALLKLEKVPKERKAVIAFVEVDELGDLVAELLDLNPSALEFMDSNTVMAVNVHPSAPFKLPERDALLVEFDDEDADKKIDIVKERLEVMERDYEEIWKYRKLGGQALTYKYGSRSDWDIAVPISQLSQAIKFVYESAGEWNVAVFGHVGDGNLHVNLLPPKKEDWLEDAIRKATEMACEMSKRFRASVSGEHGIGLLKLPLVKCEVPEETLELWRKVKLAMDPNMILNPGKKIPW
ncbi:hypothetical protein IPA_03135 [Ignicoccus pacificus DSM 13166]|uniref:D-lactate dehydrogenase (cytochrome) n=1 Tax=Ignicoccus pacificus DSM 13166 TaxID=940294 RepID=A0A977PL97_9CREN|nr:hypothetical protein IPA_03135 [Ignicoccus pacificus DSM 13166]